MDLRGDSSHLHENRLVVHAFPCKMVQSWHKCQARVAAALKLKANLTNPCFLTLVRQRL